MLKITRLMLSGREIRLQLDGRVTGKWVELLRVSAESVLDEGLNLSVDLENICFIDCEGIALIRKLMDRGVRQVNAPLFVADQIRKCSDAQNP
jgi:hypothetical protein